MRNWNFKWAGSHVVLPAAAWLALTAAAQVPGQHHPPQSSDEYAKVLEDPSRDEWQKPHEVATYLKIAPTDVIADIGAGTGYFARRFALHAAKVYAVDIDPALLAIAAKSAPSNLITVVAKPDDPTLPASSVDLVFFCDVLHHLENRPAYLRKLKAILKPGGRIVTVDFYKKPLPVGPPETMKLSEDQIIAEFQEAGFQFSKKATFLPYQYVLEFRQ